MVFLVFSDLAICVAISSYASDAGGDGVSGI